MTRPARDAAGRDVIDEDALYRKVATRLVPLLMLGFLVNYVDRVNVGYAKLQMLGDLGLTEQVYGIGAAAFFWGYLITQVPASLAIHSIGIRRCLPVVMLCWGLCSSAMMFVSSPAWFYLMRFLLGVSEAGFFPAATVCLGTWFPPGRRGGIMSLFFLAMPLGYVVSGPLAGAIMGAQQGALGLRGWQWLFLLEGLPALLIGLAMRFRLEDAPATARFLTPAERLVLATGADTARHAGTDGVHPAARRTRGFADALREPVLWHLAAISLLMNIGNWGLVFWMPSIVRQIAGGPVLHTGLLSAIPYAVAAIAMPANARHADRHAEWRAHTALPLLAAGLALAAGALLLHRPTLALAALSVATAGIMATLVMFWTLPAHVLAGTAAAGGVALVNAASSLAGIIGPALMGVLMQRTHRPQDGILVFAASLLLAALLIAFLPARLAGTVRPSPSVRTGGSTR